MAVVTTNIMVNTKITAATEIMVITIAITTRPITQIEVVEVIEYEAWR